MDGDQGYDNSFSNIASTVGGWGSDALSGLGKAGSWLGNSFTSNPGGWLAGAGSLMGLGGALSNYGAQNAQAAQQDRLLKQMNMQANRIPNSQPFLNPVKGPAEDAYMRTLAANMSMNGVPVFMANQGSGQRAGSPVGSYGANMMAEGLAGQEAMWQDKAMQQAIANAQHQNQVMGQGLNPGGQAGHPSLASIFGSSMTPLASYFGQKQGNDQQMQIMKMLLARQGQGQGQQQGQASTMNLPGMQTQQGQSTFTGGTAPDASLGNEGGSTSFNWYGNNTGQNTGSLNPYGGDYQSQPSDYAQ